MNTNKLKKFAQETRRKLLKQVKGKLEHVLSSDNGALRDKTHVVKELKKDLDRLGREALVDKVAYTWFNRFVAMRYMDARGYQPLEMSILTPQQSQVSPQILQEAMAGHIPDDLKVDRQQIMDILDGRTASSNPENEAYRQLLVASCNHLNAIFPFLFEAIDDYTELLLPDDLTSEFSIIHDVIEGMTDDDCQQVEILGWLYQFYISEKKDEVFASKGKVKKEEIPAATQLFTPRWIVEYMVQNTVGKLWVLNHPSSRLKEQMEYYIESEVTAEDVLTIDKPEELTLLDQACGSGHILVYGFELLYKIYEEEGYAPSDIPRLIIEHNLHGFEIDERAAQLAGLAVLMKAREKQKRLFRKSEVPVPNITCFVDFRLTEKEIKENLNYAGVDITDELLHDLTTMQQATNFGSLIAPHSSVGELKKAKELCAEKFDGVDLFEKEALEKLSSTLISLEKLGRKYYCSVANPPYMGSSKMNKELTNWVKNNYSKSKSDLFSCFIERSMDFVSNDGFSGLVTMESWMFLSSFEQFRKKIIDNYTIHSLSHFGWHIMRIAFGTVAFILQKREAPSDYRGIYSFMEIGDVEKETERPKVFPVKDNGRFNKISQNEFDRIPGSPIGYWVSHNEFELYKNGSVIKNHTHPAKGIDTGENAYFLRFWNEINLSKFDAQTGSGYWVPYNKGGNFRRWYGNREYVLRWNKDGGLLKSRLDWDKRKPTLRNKKHWFKSGFTWTTVSAGGFSVRYCSEGALFDNGGCTLFAEEDLELWGALLNSKITDRYLEFLSPTLNFQPGDIGAIAVHPDYKKARISKDKIKHCVKLAKRDWDTRETSWDFPQNELIRFNNEGGIENLEDATEVYKQYWTNQFIKLHQNEEELNRQFIEIYGLQEELTPEVPLEKITILQEELDKKKLKKKDAELRRQESEGRNPELPFKDKEVSAQFVSYAVDCMFGRYSLDQEGLILANQGETLEDYLNKIDKSEFEVSFLPDEDNIIPVLDDEWFEDDIVTRFHQFLKASFGEQQFQKNLSFVEEQLSNNLRNYFTKDFYKDHYKRYNKRPIYWKFSSPKGYFNVLIYMHRYTPDTLNNILNNYLREFINKLTTRKEQMQHLENTGSASEKAQASKEIDNLNAMIADCQHYEREILYPLASERIDMDLDDGVLVNYNLFGEAVEVISGVNDKTKKKKVKEFDWIDGGRIR